MDINYNFNTLLRFFRILIKNHVWKRSKRLNYIHYNQHRLFLSNVNMDRNNANNCFQHNFLKEYDGFELLCTHTTQTVAERGTKEKNWFLIIMRYKNIRVELETYKWKKKEIVYVLLLTKQRQKRNKLTM